MKAFTLTVCILVVSLASCVPVTSVPTATARTPNETQSPPASPQQSVTPEKAITETRQTQEETLSPSTAETIVTELPCPSLVPDDNSYFIEGTLLFSYWAEGSPTGVWAISKDANEPFLVIDPPPEFSPAFYTSLSSDGTKLAWALYEPENTAPSLVIYDFERQEYEKYELNVSWSFISDWIDETSLTLIGEETLEGDLTTTTYFTLNTDTLETSQTAQQLIPPDLYRDEMQPWSTFLSIDPQKELALYTSLRDQGKVYLLRNIETNEVVQQLDVGMTLASPIPAWTQNGEKAAISFATSQDGGAYEIFLLTRDGEIQELTTEPIDPSQSFDIRYLSWSPDENHLHFALGHSPLSDGPGFLLDVTTGELREICDRDNVEFLRGEWLSKNQLLYEITTSEGDTELRLLDLTTWQAQRLTVIPNNTSATPFIIHGWIAPEDGG